MTQNLQSITALVYSLVFQIPRLPGNRWFSTKMAQNALLHSYNPPDKNNIDAMFDVNVHMIFIISLDLKSGSVGPMKHKIK